jgi:hypothetical protein
MRRESGVTRWMCGSDIVIVFEDRAAINIKNDYNIKGLTLYRSLTGINREE